jgi:imidazole glycerol-phosphate synthase subunit HisH
MPTIYCVRKFWRNEFATVMTPTITVINYDAGNLYSVLRGLKACGVVPKIVLDPAELQSCDSMILPGVGAFPKGMERLRESGLSEAILDRVRQGAHLLGICLGAQLLMEWSEEFGHSEGLGIVSGGVVKLQPEAGYKVPHVGWAPLHKKRSWDKTILSSCRDEEFFYFNHSFICEPSDPQIRLAATNYGDVEFTAAFSVDGVTGIQCHPELSSAPGIDVLKQFVNASTPDLSR